jgi:hypothetical protein
VFDRFTLLNNGDEASAADGGKGSQIRLVSGMTAGSVTNTCISPKPAGWTNGGGARLEYRYVDGTLTDIPLLPWPMQGRAMAEMGVNATAIAQGYIDKAEAACR